MKKAEQKNVMNFVIKGNPLKKSEGNAEQLGVLKKVDEPMKVVCLTRTKSKTDISVVYNLKKLILNAL